LHFMPRNTRNVLRQTVLAYITFFEGIECEGGKKIETE
jgi:hypothetical protein